MTIQPVGPHAVKAMLNDGRELALIDLREELPFSKRHLLWARSVPLSRLELRFARLVPRLQTRIVLCDDGEGFVPRGAEILSRAGYSNISYLDGGVAGWEKAGLELFSGVNVPSKAFGEHIEHTSGTPSVSAQELNSLIRAGTDMVVLDSRPFDEYHRVSVPTSINVPGAELVHRVHDIVPSPDTLIVVNCAGRTRSIIGAQSLINAGVPNKVVALRNGTMGWDLAGLTCETSKNNHAPDVTNGGSAWARASAARVAARFAIPRIEHAAVEAFRGDATRTLYLLDVRDPSEYASGHVPGAVSAPGGQLVQATDQYVGTLGARIVLVDDAEVRAVMTASWLKQMGWRDVFVWVTTGGEIGFPPGPALGAAPSPQRAIDADELVELVADDHVTVVDLSLSSIYRKAHIPGSWFAIRSRLPQALAKIPMNGELVLTSEDGVLAGFASGETRVPARYLRGGNAAWQAAGYALSTELRMADDPIDVWLKPYERASDTASAMSEYLAWETDLLPRIARDGTTRFLK